MNNISTVKITENGWLVTLINNINKLSVPNDPANRHYQQVQEWIAAGNTPDPADPPPPPPTKEQIYNQVLQNQQVFKAYILAVNDGSIVPGSNMTNTQLKAAVKAKM